MIEWGYFINVPEEFTEVNSKLVENKQITNKVLLSYKKKNKDAFDDNLVVTRSDIWPALDYEQFRSVNSKKLQTTLIWYTPWTQQRISFTCGDEKVQWLYVTFNLRNTFWEFKEETYIAQYQFVHNERWYIVSFASASEKERNTADDRISDLSCG